MIKTLNVSQDQNQQAVSVSDVEMIEHWRFNELFSKLGRK